MKARKKIVKVNQAPSGLFYMPDFLQERQEKDVLEKLWRLDFNPYDHRGFLAKREIVHYGGASGYAVGAPEPKEPMPDWLKALQSRCANLVDLCADDFALTLVAHYPPGAGIGWHRDAPQFGPTVIGVSFGSTAVMRFRRFLEADIEELYRVSLAPGSAYIMSGAARSAWQHSVAPVAEARYSITFRTRKVTGDESDQRQMPATIEKRLDDLNLRFHPKAARVEDEGSTQQLPIWQ